jgi:hypothetical protein
MRNRLLLVAMRIAGGAGRMTTRPSHGGAAAKRVNVERETIAFAGNGSAPA